MEDLIYVAYLKETNKHSKEYKMGLRKFMASTLVRKEDIIETYNTTEEGWLRDAGYPESTIEEFRQKAELIKKNNPKLKPMSMDDPVTACWFLLDGKNIFGRFPYPIN